MKKVPVSYRAESLTRKMTKQCAVISIVVLIMYSAAIVLLFNDIGGKKGALLINLLSACLLPGIFYLSYRTNPKKVLFIHAANNAIVFTSGIRHCKIKPDDIIAVNSSGQAIEIVAANDKSVNIDSEDFPKINMPALADYFRSVMRKDGQINAEFFMENDSGFHVTTRTVMETPNPWPHVLFIGLCFFIVCAVVYYIFRKM